VNNQITFLRLPSSTVFKFVQGGIRKTSDVEAALNGVDAVVNLTVLVDISTLVFTLALTHEINVTGTLNLLQELAKYKESKFIFSSSTAVYGDA
jgi:UDP-glucose 4-epimerase